MENIKTAATKLEDLNLVDKFLFDETMEDREAYQALISILLENETEFLTKPETEKELRISPQLRQIRLDVVGMDMQKKLYYTEMQKRNTGNLVRRSRYYQSQIDVSLLEPGSTDFNVLSDSCFILIAPFDIFGRGLYRYTFEGACRECPELKLGDGAVKIKKIKLSEKMGVKYMQRWEEIAYARQDGIAEGLEQGREQGIAQGIKQGIQAFLLSCREVGISQEIVMDKLKKQFHLEEEAAEEYIKKFWD